MHNYQYYSCQIIVKKYENYMKDRINSHLHINKLKTVMVGIQHINENIINEYNSYLRKKYTKTAVMYNEGLMYPGSIRYIAYDIGLVGESLMIGENFELENPHHNGNNDNNVCMVNPM